jgi:hypothetical protein
MNPRRGTITDIQQCSTGLLRIVIDRFHGLNDAVFRSLQSILAYWEVTSHGKSRQALTLMSDIVFVSYDLKCNDRSLKEERVGKDWRGRSRYL